MVHDTIVGEVDESQLDIQETAVQAPGSHIVYRHYYHKLKNRMCVSNDVEIHVMSDKRRELPPRHIRRAHAPNMTPAPVMLSTPQVSGGGHAGQTEADTVVEEHPTSKAPPSGGSGSPPAVPPIQTQRSMVNVLALEPGSALEAVINNIGRNFDELARMARRVRKNWRSVLAGALVVFTITSAICNSFKTQILTAIHDFTSSTGDTFKVALYTSSASLDKTTTAYSATNEVSGTGYSSGGASLTSTTPALSGDTACCLFATQTWSSSTITARGCEVYNSSKSNKAVFVFTFGSDQTSTSGNFTLTFPAQSAGNAIIQLV